MPSSGYTIHTQYYFMLEDFQNRGSTKAVGIRVSVDALYRFQSRIRLLRSIGVFQQLFACMRDSAQIDTAPT